jgi:hypothetical protein
VPIPRASRVRIRTLVARAVPIVAARACKKLTPMVSFARQLANLPSEAIEFDAGIERSA